MKLLWSLVVLLFVADAFGAPVPAPPAPDFPPGAFIDGRNYSIRDYEGKVVVLIFYHRDCPKYRAGIEARTRLIEQYRQKPVRFFAVAGGDTVVEARAFAAATGQDLPTFADHLSLMQKRYGANVSANNGFQVRMIGADGKLAKERELTADAIDNLVDDARFKYKGQGYDPKLDPAIDRLESGQYADAIKLIKPVLGNARKETADSAKKLLDAIREEGQGWLTRAETAVQENPCEAYALYEKTVASFRHDDLGRKANDALRKLQTNPMVKDELAARQMWQTLAAGILKARAADREQIKDFAAEIARRYSKTPTGEKAAELVKEMM